MARAAIPLARRPAPADFDPGGVLNALPDPVLAVDGQGTIRYVNLEAQEFFEAGATVLVGARLADFLPPDSPVFGLIEQVRAEGCVIREHGVALATPRIGSHLVTVRAAPLGDPHDGVVVSLQEESIARKIDSQLTHRHAARSVTAMAAMLAHEVKNPLSGIRGAAQLLEESVPEQDRELTRLICDEADRIVGLVNRMEVFSDGRPLEREPVNIHAVLEHVRRIAQSGFARHVRFVERYDPSLPPVLGNRDLLVQALLNLVKNAAEAAPAAGGEIVLSTAYRHGLRLAVPGSDGRVHLPLAVTVQDNGPGIPEDLRPHLFDAFVTTKVNGSGLGLALVAKIVGDHGGIIDVESEPRRTAFTVFLPTSNGPAGPGEQGP